MICLGRLDRSDPRKLVPELNGCLEICNNEVEKLMKEAIVRYRGGVRLKLKDFIPYTVKQVPILTSKSGIVISNDYQCQKPSRKNKRFLRCAQQYDTEYDRHDRSPLEGADFFLQRQRTVECETDNTATEHDRVADAG